VEKQSNGNFHIHIITDKFIPHQDIKEIWNRIQNKLGYVDRYSDRMNQLSYNEYKASYRGNKKYSESSIKANWTKGKKSGWKFPNSTDIHSLQFINDIDKYLLKYVTKSDQNKGIEGRLWGCSHSLSNLNGGREIIDSSISTELNKVDSLKGVKKIKDDFYTIYFTDIKQLKLIGCKELVSIFEAFVKERFG
jgi:hypothetical protein